jgi:hypothetical protein
MALAQYPAYAERVITKLMAVGVFFGACLLPLDLPAAPGSERTPFEFSTQAGPGLLDVTYQGRRILRYSFATNQFKPYVRELYTLKGDNILLDAPPDHLHHHGLMYAIRVNGVNFWEERDQPGFEKPVRLEQLETSRSSTGLPKASFVQMIHWVANTDAAPPDSGALALLVERRTITLTIDETRGEVALDWHAEFEVGAGADHVTLSGANYHGLGLRLPPAFNRIALRRNSEGAPYLTEGKGDVTRARWSAVSHRVDNRDITVALFGPAPTQSGLPCFFTMVQPFTYLSVTQGLDKAPIQHSAGDKFRIDYRLVAYSEAKTTEFLQDRYSKWTTDYWPLTKTL